MAGRQTTSKASEFQTMTAFLAGINESDENLLQYFNFVLLVLSKNQG